MAGKLLRGRRISDILRPALGVDKDNIHYADLTDRYGTPATGLKKGENRYVVINRIAVRDIVAGDVESVFQARHAFLLLAMADKNEA